MNNIETEENSTVPPPRATHTQAMAKRIQKDVQHNMQQFGQMFENLKEQHLGEGATVYNLVIETFCLIQTQLTSQREATCLCCWGSFLIL